MPYIDSIIYCSQLNMSRESSIRDSYSNISPLSSPEASPSLSYLRNSLTDNIPKSPIDIIAKKRGESYQKLTISASCIKKNSINMRSAKANSCIEFSNSPSIEPKISSPLKRSTYTPDTDYSSKKAINKPFYMLPIVKPILATSNNYINSIPSFFRILCNSSKFFQNEFSFIPVDEKYEIIKNNNCKSYSCHGVKFSKSKFILTNKGATILNIKKREIRNSIKGKICDVVYLNKLDEHFKIVVEITNKFDNDIITIVCTCDAYNQNALIYNNYPEKGGNVIGVVRKFNNFEEDKLNSGWFLEIAPKVDIPLIMIISIFYLKNLNDILS